MSAHSKFVAPDIHEDFFSSLLGGLQTFAHSIDVLIAATGQIDNQNLIGFHLTRNFQSMRNRVRRFQGGNDSFQARKSLKSIERFVIRDRSVFNSSLIMKKGMLGANRRIIKTRRDRMRRRNLSAFILKHVT